MNFNLLVNYYLDKDADRAAECNFCILENLRNPLLGKVMVIANQYQYEHLLSICPDDLSAKILPCIEDKRPTYNDYFSLIRRYFSGEDNVNVISNLDIIIPCESLLYSTFYFVGNSCLALTRWDIYDSKDYKANSRLFNTPDSQDTWIFKGSVHHIAGADFTLGVAGCDNKIAYLLESAGYDVKNPSINIKTFHYHITNKRNYTDIVGNVIERIPPPYKLLHPSE